MVLKNTHGLVVRADHTTDYLGDQDCINIDFCVSQVDPLIDVSGINKVGTQKARVGC